MKFTEAISTCGKELEIMDYVQNGIKIVLKWDIKREMKYWLYKWSMDCAMDKELKCTKYMKVTSSVSSAFVNQEVQEHSEGKDNS